MFIGEIINNIILKYWVFLEILWKNKIVISEFNRNIVIDYGGSGFNSIVYERFVNVVNKIFLL